MAQLLVGKQPVGASPPENGSARPKYTLNVVLVYEDTATHEWAREVHARVSQVAGGESVRSTWWNVGDFNQPGVLAGAVSTAMRADVVVIAIRETEEMRLPFYVWVRSWLPNRSKRKGALVALIGVNGAKERETGGVSDYLRAAATTGHLDFLMEKRLLPGGSRPGAREKTSRRLLSKVPAAH